MSKKPYLTGLALLSGCSLMLLSGCIDSDYDLSDIDTETEIRVNDLVLPVNIDQMTLDDVISIDKDSKLKIIDGKYAVVVEGEFHSGEIKISKITSKAPVMESNTVSLSPRNAGRAAAYEFDVPSFSSDFAYRDDHIDGAIKSLIEVETHNFSISLLFSMPAMQSLTSTMTLSDLRIQLPRGLETADSRYDASTGIFTVDEAKGTPERVAVRLDISGFDIANTGAVFNASARTFDFKGRVTVMSAVMSFDNISGSLPADLSLTTEYDLSQLDVATVTGDIVYNVDDFNVDPIDLSDMPKFLSQGETNLILDNPQIYLTINNPMGMNGAIASTGLTLTAERDGERPRDFNLDKGRFDIDHTMGDGPYKFCISPRVPATYYPGYENATHEDFTTLSDVLSGKGLPKRITVTADAPRFEGYPVKKLPIGQTIESIAGKYVFFAPLALEAGSSIVYTKTTDGWGSEDLDAVTIETLEVTATITSDIDQAVRITGYPIDAQGHPIGDVVIEGAEIPAMAEDYPITIRTTGEVTNLDGFVYVVTTISKGSEQLRPDQHIILKNIRAKASGKYVKEL